MPLVIAAIACSRTPKWKFRRRSDRRRPRARRTAAALDRGVVRAREIGGAADQERRAARRAARSPAPTACAWPRPCPETLVASSPTQPGRHARSRVASQARRCSGFASRQRARRASASSRSARFAADALGEVRAHVVRHQERRARAASRAPPWCASPPRRRAARRGPSSVPAPSGLPRPIVVRAMISDGPLRLGARRAERAREARVVLAVDRPARASAAPRSARAHVLAEAEARSDRRS